MYSETAMKRIVFQKIGQLISCTENGKPQRQQRIMSEIKTCPHCHQKNRIPSDRIVRDAKCASCGCILSGSDADIECSKCRYRFNSLVKTKDEIVRCPKCRKVVSDRGNHKIKQRIINSVLAVILFALAIIGINSLSGWKIY